MTRQELINKLQSTNPEQVKNYLEVLDRMLIHHLITKLFDSDEVKQILQHWQKQVKSEINFESSTRNNLLMGTPVGRLMSYNNKVEDGEALRLTAIEAMKVAKDIAWHNYFGNMDEEVENY